MVCHKKVSSNFNGSIIARFMSIKVINRIRLFTLYNIYVH